MVSIAASFDSSTNRYPAEWPTRTGLRARDLRSTAQHRGNFQHDVAHSKRNGTGGYRSQKLERILDTAHFVDSKLSRMIQLAGMAAFILRRRASFPTEHDPRLEARMHRLSQLVTDCVPDPKGQYHTIR